MNGTKCLWEGRISGFTHAATESEQGVTVNCLGYWGDILMKRTWRKPWADTRLDTGTWVTVTTATGAEKCEEDRDNRIRFTPKNVAWTTNQYAAVQYAAPTGETIKRVTYNYDLQEAAQNWQAVLYDPDGTTDLDSKTASGTGAVDVTLATPRNRVWLAIRAGANQTPTSDGTYYAEFSSVTVYTETGDIHSDAIIKDLRGHVSELSANETEISANTLDMVPFYTETETLADIAAKIAGYGDSDLDAWAACIRESDISTDDKPILCFEQQPTLTDYDWIVRLDEQHIADIAVTQTVDEIFNWIGYQYTEENGTTVYQTPDDDAALEDTVSQADYGGERHQWLTINTTSATTADNFAKRFLAAHKDLQWIAESIPVIGSIQAKDESWHPVSEVRAGERVRIASFLDDLSGNGLTFLITQTNYTDEGQTNNLTVGRPLYFMLSYQARIDDGRKI